MRRKTVVEFSIKAAPLDLSKLDACVIFVSPNNALPKDLGKSALTSALTALLKRGDLDAKTGATLLLPILPNESTGRVLLVRIGEEWRDKDWTSAVRSSVKALLAMRATRASLRLPDQAPDIRLATRLAVIAAHDASYRFDEFKKPDPLAPSAPKRVDLFVDPESTKAATHGLNEGRAIAHGLNLAKDLGNLPPNVCTPTYLAGQVVALAKEFGLKHEVLDRTEMARLGMNALLAVAQGSKEPPKLIVAHYRGGKKNSSPVVLIGKGITFDSGGISLKPGEGMDEMKYDMCGAASVIGTLRSVAEMKLPINLSIIVPATENMPSGTATRPGDIVASMSGQTVEILNTDAEGRLILCDALTYSERFKPAAIIDVATLTGACVIALGHVASGLFTTNENLRKDLTSAGERSGDRVWPMPLWDDYQEQLKSNFADMANIGGRPAGAVTAACFLARFAKHAEWAHLDIAGTAWKSGADKGSTGRPVGLLCDYLIARASA